MSYVEASITGTITALLIAILAYVALKTHRIEEIITSSIENVVNDVANDVELQKNLYQVGGLIGNGAKSGFGLQKRAGKTGLTDLLLGLAGQYLGVDNKEETHIRENGGIP